MSLARLQHVGGKRMPQHMRRTGFVDARAPRAARATAFCTDCSSMMVAPLHTRAWVHRPHREETHNQPQALAVSGYFPRPAHRAARPRPGPRPDPAVQHAGAAPSARAAAPSGSQAALSPGPCCPFALARPAHAARTPHPSRAGVTPQECACRTVQQRSHQPLRACRCSSSSRTSRCVSTTGRRGAFRAETTSSSHGKSCCALYVEEQNRRLGLVLGG